MAINQRNLFITKQVCFANLSDKIDTLDTSVSGLNTFVQESRSSLTLLENQIKDIRISVEQLIILYDIGTERLNAHLNCINEYKLHSKEYSN